MAGDEVYGADPRLRSAISGHRLGYVMAIAANRRVPTHAGPIRADALPAAIERDATPTPTGLIAFTVNEFRRIFDALLLTAHQTLTSLLAWSRWRRRHQHRARLSYYKRR